MTFDVAALLLENMSHSSFSPSHRVKAISDLSGPAGFGGRDVLWVRKGTMGTVATDNPRSAAGKLRIGFDQVDVPCFASDSQVEDVSLVTLLRSRVLDLLSESSVEREAFQRLSPEMMSAILFPMASFTGIHLFPF